MISNRRPHWPVCVSKNLNSISFESELDIISKLTTRLDQVRPSDEELRVILETGFALRYTRRLDEAGEIFRGVVALLPEADVPRVALGTVELERGKFAAAQAACEEALRFHPESLYARVHRAEALLFQRRRDEAEAELNAIIVADPESPHSRTASSLLEAADLICAG